jgi:hypothetical protein
LAAVVEKVLSGGDKLETRLREIAAGLARGATLRVGFLEGSTYPDGTSVPMVAALQEFGAPRASIPPRPFFRGMIAKHGGEWGDQIGAALVHSDFDAAQALDQMGQVIATELQGSIADTMAPALSPITVMLRKMRSEDQSLVVTGKVVGEAAARVAAGETSAGISTKPLVDSGHLMASVAYEVKG